MLKIRHFAKPRTVVSNPSRRNWYLMKRKLQIFVSSTYSDLKGERQAAVEAILRSGNIPAGMELFAAGSVRWSNLAGQLFCQIFQTDIIQNGGWSIHPLVVNQSVIGGDRKVI